jgi:hypothetical protein
MFSPGQKKIKKIKFLKMLILKEIKMTDYNYYQDGYEWKHQLLCN